MKINESSEMYLETILVLSQRQKIIKAIDIAKSMEYSRASVSIALKNLKENKYISINEFSHITLNKKGLEIAQNIFDRHQTITSLLVYIGVDKNIAENDACKIEHDISDETLYKIKSFLKRKDKIDIL